MTGSIMRPKMPPAELISSTASSVALSWVCSMAEVTPVWENRTPTRHGLPLSLVESMSPFVPQSPEKAPAPTLRQSWRRDQNRGWRANLKHKNHSRNEDLSSDFKSLMEDTRKTSKGR